MTNETKRKVGIIGNIVAIIVCLAMLMGTTFAWFTDSETNSGNVIKSGALNLEAYWALGTQDPAAATTTWNDIDSADAVYNYGNWEPGYTVARHFKIANEGSLAFKYKLVIVPNGAVSALAEVIDVYYVNPATQIDEYTDINSDLLVGTLADLIADPDGAAHGILLPESATPNNANEVKGSTTATVVFKMRESAGNEYENMAIGDNFDIKVIATQYAFEADDLGTDYDANATYPVFAQDSAALSEAINSGASTIVLSSGTYEMPDSAKGKELKIVGDGSTTVSVVDDGASEGDIDYSLEGSDVTFENLTLNIEGSNYPGYARIASATYNNCTIKGANYCLYGDSVFNNCTFDLNNGYVWTWGAAKVEFNNCTFEDKTGSKAKAILVHNTVETTVIVKDCTFKATSPAQTWDGISVAAVSIDPENGSPDATVYFVGNNTYDPAFKGLYQVKYADEVDDVTVYVNGTAVTLTAEK